MAIRASETIEQRDARLGIAKERQNRSVHLKQLSYEMQDWKPI